MPPTFKQLGFGAVGAFVDLLLAGGVNGVWMHFIGRHADPWTRILASHHGPTAFVLDILGGSVVSPIAEEALFRGLLFAGLAQRMPVALAAAASATLFGLVHLNPWGLPSLVTSGLVLAWVYYRTRNLWASITTHGVANLVAFSALYAAQAFHAH